MKGNVSLLLNTLGFETEEIGNIQERLIAELRKVYSSEKIRLRVEEGQNLRRTSDLKEKLKLCNCYLARRSTQKRSKIKVMPPLKDLINSLYPEYPNLFFLISNKVELDNFNPVKIGEDIAKKYYEGEDISASTIKTKDEILHRWLTVYSKDKTRKKGRMKLKYKEEDGGSSYFRKFKRDVTQIIHKLSGIRIKNFSIRGSKKVKTLGTMSEYLSRILLASSCIDDPSAKKQTKRFNQCFPTPLENIYPVNGKVTDPRGIRLRFEPPKEGDRKIFADLVAESDKDVCMIEVKNLRSAPDNVLNDIKYRFCNSGRTLYWMMKEKEISKKTLIIHSKKEIYEKINNHMLGTGVNVVSPSEFRESLEVAVENIEKAGYIRTNVYSSDEILKMYDMLAEKPYILIRPSHKHKFNFFNRVIRELTDRLQKENKPECEPVKLYSNTGQTFHNSEGTFQLFKLSINDLPDLYVKQFVKERLQKISEGKLFMDVESTGFVGNQIFLLGTAYRKEDDFRFELAFARNPWEEEAMLKHFCTQSMNYEQVVTYNGITFDYNAIKNRLEAMMMKDKFQQNHFDLYPPIRDSRDYHKLKSAKLVHLYELFGDKREDASSAEVPLIYSNWITNGKPSVIEKDLEHNVLDLLGLGAIYLSPNLARNGTQKAL